jgi:hypothetical protein
MGALLVAMGVFWPALLVDGNASTATGPSDAAALRTAEGDAAQETSQTASDRGAVAWGTRRATLTYVLVCLTFVSFLGAQVGFNTQLYTIAGDYGIAAAGGALGVVAAMGMLARVIGIVVIRWVPAEAFLGVMAVFQGLSALVLVLRPDQVGLYASAGLLGMAVGNASVLSPVIVLHTFGAARYSRLLARLSFATTLGIASGPVVVGAIRSALGGYDAVLVGLSLVSFGVAGLCWLLAGVTWRGWGGTPSTNN